MMAQVVAQQAHLLVGGAHGLDLPLERSRLLLQQPLRFCHPRAPRMLAQGDEHDGVTGQCHGQRQHHDGDTHTLALHRAHDVHEVEQGVERQGYQAQKPPSAPHRARGLQIVRPEEAKRRPHQRHGEDRTHGQVDRQGPRRIDRQRRGMPQHPDDGVQLDGREDGKRHDQRPLPRDAEQQRERRDVAGQGVEPQKRLRPGQPEHGEVAQRDQRHAADERDEGRRAAEAALRQRVHDEQRNDKPGQTQHERRQIPFHRHLSLSVRPLVRPRAARCIILFARRPDRT